MRDSMFYIEIGAKALVHYIVCACDYLSLDFIISMSPVSVYASPRGFLWVLLIH